MPEKFKYNGDKYAVAVRSDKGLMILETYRTKKALEKGYIVWNNLAIKRCLLKPSPIEILDESGTSKVLEDMVK